MLSLSVQRTTAAVLQLSHGEYTHPHPQHNRGDVQSEAFYDKKCLAKMRKSLLFRPCCVAISFHSFSSLSQYSSLAASSFLPPCCQPWLSRNAAMSSSVSSAKSSSSFRSAATAPAITVTARRESETLRVHFAQQSIPSVDMDRKWTYSTCLLKDIDLMCLTDSAQSNSISCPYQLCEKKLVTAPCMLAVVKLR